VYKYVLARSIRLELTVKKLNCLDNTVNPSYNGLMGGGRASISTDVRYNRVKGYSRKYITGYIASTRNTHSNTQCDYIKVFVAGLVYFYF
jgi:hypothetical protein